MEPYPVAKILEAHHVPFRSLPQSKAGHSIEEAARDRNMRTGQLSKCLLCSNSHGEILCFVVPGDRSLDLSKGRKAAGERRMKFIAREEVEEKLGLIPGAISPVQLFGKARIFIDPALTREDEIAISGGVPGGGVAMKPADLVKFLKPEVVEIT